MKSADQIDLLLLREIDKAWEEDWTSPPIRALAKLIGRSPSITYKRLNRLVATGHLETRRSGDKVVYRRAQ